MRRTTHARHAMPFATALRFTIAACAIAASQAAGAASDGTDSADIEVFHRFKNKGNGIQPKGALVRASDGALYGATARGGPGDYGTLFRIGSDGSYSTFATFSLSEGVAPVGDLVQAADGKLYGVTSQGGDFNRGTVFRIALDGTRELLHAFTEAYGARPASGLTLAADGHLYGVLNQGGERGRGLLYRVSTDGSFSWATEFGEKAQEQCAITTSRLAAAPDGTLYGVGNRCLYAAGTDGKIRVLHHFYFETALGVLLGSDGNLYVTTAQAGFFCQHVQRVTPEGKVHVMYEWRCKSEKSLMPGLAQGPDGALHGAFTDGEGSEARTVFFKLGLNGTYTQLRVSSARKGFDVRSLAWDPDGYYYGNAEDGGIDRKGTVLRTRGGD